MGKTKYRVITCQGTIQLVSAICAVLLRDKRRTTNFKNILVVYDLYCPQCQIEFFFKTIVEMAQTIMDWERVIYFAPEDLNVALQFQDDEKSLKSYILSKITAPSVDEIYLGTDVHPSNLAMIKAFPEAYRVCFGDGLGIYIPSNYSYLTRNEPSLASAQQKSFWNWLKRKFSEKYSRAYKTFDEGYFVFPDIYKKRPPFPFKLVPKELVRDIFSKMEPILDRNEVDILLDKLRGKNVTVLMTSNFSEAQRMSLDSEIEAYKRFISDQQNSSDNVLIIKPHPRDDLSKINKLIEALDDLFDYVLCMKDDILPYIPFELFLQKLQATSPPPQNICVCTFSTSFISLKLLFNVETKIGFGSTLVSEFFFAHSAEDRIKHETDLSDVFSTLTSSLLENQR